MTALEMIESERLEAQSSLDLAKPHSERNKLGQFATPTVLARQILAYSKTLIPNNTFASFLDPAFGTGSFYSALLNTFQSDEIEKAIGFEVDPHYGHKAQQLWRNTSLHLRIEDFTRIIPPTNESEKANLLICNPPYVRHHHMPVVEKVRLQQAIIKSPGIALSGLAGLYCYFLCLSDAWMSNGGIAAWLIPSEFMDVNYGEQLKRYLLDKVTLIRIHRFDPNEVQFGDALVSSAVVWFRKSPPTPHHSVEFTFGGSLVSPRISKMIPSVILRGSTKWTKFPTAKIDADLHPDLIRISDLFTIKRGVATGANNFFIIDEISASQNKLSQRFLIPILPGPRYLQKNEVETDSNGMPLVDKKLFLISCPLPESEVQAKHPALWTYLQNGIKNKINQQYLCRHRSPWYSQEIREPAPFVCTYMGRSDSKQGRPFRFILNRSKAIVANVYLMLYPRPEFEAWLRSNPKRYREVWTALNNIPINALAQEGRIYGGGLYKMEPRELANAPIPGFKCDFPPFNRQPEFLSS